MGTYLTSIKLDFWERNIIWSSNLFDRHMYWMKPFFNFVITPSHEFCKLNQGLGKYGNRNVKPT